MPSDHIFPDARQTITVTAPAAQPYAGKELRFAASARCQCGAGLAYPPADRPNAWLCSKVLLGKTEIGTDHDRYPFIFWNILSEIQPTAEGKTTRPKDVEPESLH